MRPAIRRYCTFVGAILVTATLCYLRIRPHGRNKACSHLDFLDRALPTGSIEFRQSRNDGTGGWSTRLFGSESSLGNTTNDAINISSSRWPRCPVHTYFDYSLNGQDSTELAILSAWVRVFSALGFIPVVLTEKDARSNPRYSVFQKHDLLNSTSFPLGGPLLAMAKRGGLFVDYHVSSLVLK